MNTNGLKSGLMSLIASVALSACGGSTPTIGVPDAPVGGAAAGGATSVEGTGGSGTQVCCDAIPTCNAGDLQVSVPANCPAGTKCYSAQACCTQIWCAHYQVESGCNAMTGVSCSPGDQMVQVCPAADACYWVFQCGTPLLCYSRNGSICNVAPSCFGSDIRVTSCPVPNACYTQSACGSSVLCYHPGDAGA